MKATKTQLEAMIRESVQKALEGLDYGDKDWLSTRQDDDAIRQNLMRKGSGSPIFGQMIQAAQAAQKKIQTSNNQERIAVAARLKTELEQLSQAPESGAVIMKARLITGKLIALAKQG
jgi:hypothetical protein